MLKKIICASAIMLSFVSVANQQDIVDNKYKNMDIELYNNYVTAKKSVDLYIGSDISYVKEGNKILGKIIEENDNFAPAYLELARINYIYGYKREAIDLVSKALEIEPDYPDAYVYQGFIHYTNKNNFKAMESLTKAEKLGTSNPWLDLNWASVYESQGLPEKMFERCMSVFASDEENKTAYKWSAQCLINYYQNFKRDFENADKYYLKHIELTEEFGTDDKSKAWTYGNYAYFLGYMKMDFENAIEYSDKAKEILDYSRLNFQYIGFKYGLWAKYTLDESHDESYAKELLGDANNELLKLNKKGHPVTLRDIVTFFEHADHIQLKELAIKLGDEDASRMTDDLLNHPLYKKNLIK